MCSIRLFILSMVIGFGSLSWASEPGSANSCKFYVAPGGNDQNPGISVEQPFATITRARDAIRELKKKGKLDGSADVYLRGGMYPAAEPIEFTPEDNGNSSKKYGCLSSLSR